MKVSEAIAILQKLDPNGELIAYSPCGPDYVTDIRASWSPNEVVIELGNECCEYILECHSNGSKSTAAQAAHRAEVERRNGEKRA